MSQSDYIQFKKASSILKTNQVLNDLDAVLSNSDYLKYKQYSIINKVKSTSQTKNNLMNLNHVKIFNMEKNVSSCPNNFIVCNQTQNRFNKTTNKENLLFRGYKQKNPMHEFYLYKKKERNGYPRNKECDVMEKCNEYFFLRDQNHHDTDDELEVYIG